ncbi:MAG: sugar phosphate isomerase/epimerase [Planctomycetota bacterium]
MPYRLSAFADEISPDIQIQMDHLLENGVKCCTMRGANGKNVMEFEDFQVNIMKPQFLNRGIRIAAIGSPIGKVKITDPFDAELARLKKAIKLAKGFETKVIRIFSFYIPEGDDPRLHQAEVLKRMKGLAEAAKAENVNLELENEKGIYGDIADRHLEILEQVNMPNLRAAFDFSNFVQCGEDPLSAWGKLKNWVVDFHVKDCRKADRKECPAGQGEGKIREILKDAFASGWGGFLTLEPHLSAGGQFAGFTGAALFKTAVDALKGVLAEAGAK